MKSAWLVGMVSFSMAALSTVADEARTQQERAEEVQRGSDTAKGGFQNEDEIRNKFNNWKEDQDARAWLEAMNYSPAEIMEVTASKPHGEKADVEVRVKTRIGERLEGISIKLVSNPHGFNQIDKRWLATYAKKWNMPTDVYESLKLFVGELPPVKPSRNDQRMFLDELSKERQKSVREFFTKHRDEIVSDLVTGDGEHAAGWMMVTLKETSSQNQGDTKGPISQRSGDSEQSAEEVANSVRKPRWVIRSTVDAMKFYGDGEVRITHAGSLKIGRVTMQRKGGDNGRESAKMLQFKINPVDLFELP